MTLVVNDFFNIKNSKHFVMQSNVFGMYGLANLVKYMIVSHSRCLVFLNNQNLEILS
jgi:hypothetical protein